MTLSRRSFITTSVVLLPTVSIVTPTLAAIPEAPFDKRFGPHVKYLVVDLHTHCNVRMFSLPYRISNAKPEPFRETGLANYYDLVHGAWDGCWEGPRTKVFVSRTVPVPKQHHWDPCEVYYLDEEPRPNQPFDENRRVILPSFGIITHYIQGNFSMIEEAGWADYVVY